MLPLSQHFVSHSCPCSKERLLHGKPCEIGTKLVPTYLFCTFASQFSLRKMFCGRFPQLFFELTPSLLWLGGRRPQRFCPFVFRSSLRKRFCGRFSQVFFAFVSQSSRVMWKAPLTLLYMCLSVFSPKKLLWKVLPTFLYICLPVFCSKKGLWKVPSTFLFVHVSPSLLFEKVL